MKHFAKLFETAEHGQVLVLRQLDDEGRPEIRVIYDAQLEGLETGELAFTYRDVMTRDESFDLVDLDTASKAAEMAKREVKELLDGRS